MPKSREAKSVPLKKQKLKTEQTVSNRHFKENSLLITSPTLKWSPQSRKQRKFRARNPHGLPLKGNKKKTRRKRLMICSSLPMNLTTKSIWRISMCDRHLKLSKNVSGPCKIKRRTGKTIWLMNTTRQWQSQRKQLVKCPTKQVPRVRQR